jgi:hypothetical protein
MDLAGEGVLKKGIKGTQADYSMVFRRSDAKALARVGASLGASTGSVTTLCPALAKPRYRQS